MILQGTGRLVVEAGKVADGWLQITEVSKIADLGPRGELLGPSPHLVSPVS